MQRSTLPRRRPKSGKVNTLALSQEPHAPLLARWIIQVSLCLGWQRKTNSFEPPVILEDDNFAKLTRIAPPWKVDEDGDVILDRKTVMKMTDRKMTIIFEKRLAELEKEAVSDELPIFRNVSLLSKFLSLNEAEQVTLRFALAFSSFSIFRNIIQARTEEISHQQFIQILAAIGNVPAADVATALNEGALLRSSGIIKVDPGAAYLEDKIDLIDRLAPLLLMPGITEKELIAGFLRPAGNGSLDLSAFPHLSNDIQAMEPYLRHAMARREAGINILFYGAPGTGKTELAKALAHEIGLDLFEISYADESGDPITGIERLRAYNLCQRITAKMPNALLMFDEIEDVLSPDPEEFFRALLGGGSSSGHGKAWINRTLEQNPVPAIWVTNNPHVDPAYLRRFDYSVRFPIPPQSVRLTIARHHFGEFKPSETWLNRIVANEQVSPAQLERAARVARLVAPDTPEQAMSVAEQTLDRSATLLQQKRTPARNTLRTSYDLRYVNTDIDLPRVIAGLRQRPRGTFCFYGPAGTGKSELGRHMADAIDKPVLLRRASDLLSMWVGESEKNIAEMFAEARQRDAVLILDEADSFLADRRDAHASWEVTQVNELLTQMEAFEGIFICTTNLMQKLDQASLRRFAFKVKFDYLKPEQREAMFLQELERLGGNALDMSSWCEQVRKLSQLTPGDFSVAARQFELWGGVPTAGEFFTQLKKECIAKGAPARGIGFTV